MTAVAVSVRETRPHAVLVLGISTFIALVLTVVLTASYEGPRLIGLPADTSAGVSLLLLACTVAALVRTLKKRPMRKSEVVGLTSAVGAYPAAVLPLYLAYMILGALGIF